MAAYQKSIHELHMPKPSEKKRNEREQLQRKLKTNPRERKPYEDYLSTVKDLNKQAGERRLASVVSLTNLDNNAEMPPNANQNSEPRSRNFRQGRLSQQPTSIRSPINAGTDEGYH